MSCCSAFNGGAMSGAAGGSAGLPVGANYVNKLLRGDATLSGGARVASADAPLPDRITVALDTYITSVAGDRSGIAFDPDGLHVWVTARSANAVRKVRISDGAIVTSFTSNASDGGTRNIASPDGLQRRGTKIYFANSGAGNYVGEIDTSTLVCRLYANAVVAAPTHIACAESGKVWVRTGSTGSGTYNELTLSGTGDAATTAATGRTQASMFDAIGNNAGTHMFFTSGAVITRLKLDDNATATVAPISANFPSLIGFGATWRGLAWDPTLDQLLVWGTIDQWMLVNAAFSAIEARAFGFPEFGGPLFNGGTNNTTFTRTGVAFSDDGSKVAFPWTESGAAATTMTHVRIMNIGVQRARWTWSPSMAVSIKRISVPGELANARGKVGNVPSGPAFLAGTYDFRTTKLFYSINEGARTEITEIGGELTSPIAVSAGQSLALDVDFQRSPYIPLGPRPWVGAQGPEIFYT